MLVARRRTLIDVPSYYGAQPRGERPLSPARLSPRSARGLCPSHRPTVSLDVISLVASSCGYYGGSNRATRCAIIHGARGDIKRARETYTTPPSATRSARCPHAGASLQTSMAAPEEWHRAGTLSRSRTPWWRTREKKRPQRLTIPRDALPTRPSYFRLLAMASPHWMLVGSH